MSVPQTSNESVEKLVHCFKVKVQSAQEIRIYQETIVRIDMFGSLTELLSFKRSLV